VDLFDKASPAVAWVLVRDAEDKPLARGTGFFLSADGMLVTNRHVIAGGTAATVQLSDNRVLKVEGVAAVDREGDLVLLKTEGRQLAHLPVGPDAPPRVGTAVYTIGNPEGQKNTFSSGMISGGLRTLASGRTVIQFDAPISQGSSGGPLLTEDGKVVGVIWAFKRTGQNLNFAVPAQRIRRLLAARGPLKSIAEVGADPPASEPAEGE